MTDKSEEVVDVGVFGSVALAYTSGRWGGGAVDVVTVVILA